MKKLFVFSLFLLLSFSCKEDFPKKICGVENPVEKLEWLSDLVQSLEDRSQNLHETYKYVSRAVYKNEYAYILNNCCPFCNTIVIVYNCEGIIKGHLGYGTGSIDSSLLQDSTIIWKLINFACKQ